jgi:hypothetical protein
MFVNAAIQRKKYWKTPKNIHGALLLGAAPWKDSDCNPI